MATFDHYKQVVPAGFYNLVFEHVTVGAPDVQLCTLGYGAFGYDIDATDLALLGDAWVENIMPAIGSDITFVRVIANDAGGAVIEENYGIAGSDVDETVSVNSAILVEKRSGVSGRRNRGRMYIPGVSENQVDAGGNLAALYLAGWQDNVDAFLAAVIAVNVAAGPQILHSKGWNGTIDDEPPDPGNAPNPTPITSLTVGAKIGTQRRRIR